MTAKRKQAHWEDGRDWRNSCCFNINRLKPLYVCLVIKPCLCDWCSGHNAKSRLPLAIDSAKLTTSSGLRDNSSARLLGPVTGLPVVGLQRLRRARRHESFEGSLFTSPITRNRLAKEVGRRK